MADRMLAEHRNLAIKREMTVRREEYLEYLTFQRMGPPIFTEIFGPLIGLKEEWAAQGATPSELDFSAYRFRHPLKYGVRVNTGWFGGPEPVVLEETDADIIGRDRYGRKVRLVKSAASLPLPIDYPVTTMDDWQAIKSHYAFTEDRFGKNWLEEARRHRDQGYVITIGVPGGFDEARQLLGEGALCETYYTNPDLVHDILTTIGDTACRILETVADAIPVDTLQIHEDMAGKSGPLVGPRQIEDFIGPYYRRVWNVVQERGTPLFDQDSDGDMRPVLAAFLDTGLNMTHPNEPAAGMDVVAMRAEYGESLVLVGGLDKHVIRRTQEEIEAELEYKIPPMVRTGGCVLGLDHRIPNGTPLANYRFYIDKAWEIMTREWREISGEDEIA